MRNLSFALMSSAFLVCCAEPPPGWTFHGWGSYKPDPSVESVADEGSGVLRVHGVEGERGMQLVSTNHIPAVRGDRLVIAFEAKGKGLVSAAANHQDARGRWNPPSGPFSRAAFLSKDWRPYRFSFDVGEGKSAPTAFVTPAIGCGHGNDLTFRNFRAELQRAPRKLPSISPEDTFDPSKAGWRLSFVDDFDGSAGSTVDKAKWEVLRRKDFVDLDGDGHLRIACDFGKETNKLESATLWTRDSWLYGYFESRLKFTKNNGWWSSFWLYSWTHRNPSEDGSELDIYEDANTRHLKDGKNPIALDHTMHLYMGDSLASYSVKSVAKGSIDDFHVVGCKWTPFEISVYIDGRRTATFDAFSQGTIATPLHALLSGCIMRSWGARDTTGFKFPEHFTVDYVKVWEYPREGEPKVEWKESSDPFSVCEGHRLSFEVDVKGEGAIRNVYLFDSGRFLDGRASPPWRFELPFDEKGFSSTRFPESGSQGVPPDWRAMLHSFVAYAVDGEGRIGRVEIPRRHVLLSSLSSAKKVSAVQKIPGKVALSDVPDGMARKIGTNDRIACDVDVAEDGEYEAVLDFGTVRDSYHKVFVLMDGLLAGTVKCPPATSYAMRKSEPVRMVLKAGRHRFIFLPVGFMFAGPVEFSLKR